MIKNNKININLGDGNNVSGTQKAKNKATIRKLWKLLKNMNCTTCNFECTHVCDALQHQIRVLEIENAGGKSDFLYAVDTSEEERTVPMEIYQQLLQQFADLKTVKPVSELPEIPKPAKSAKKAADNADTHADEPPTPEKIPAKTRSDATAEEKPDKSPAKKGKFPSIKESVDAALKEEDPFEGIDAGSKKKESEQLEIENQTRPAFLDE